MAGVKQKKGTFSKTVTKSIYEDIVCREDK
jgi:hypothetical protein